MIPYPTALLLLALIAAHRLAWQARTADAIDVEAMPRSTRADAFASIAREVEAWLREEPA